MALTPEEVALAEEAARAAEDLRNRLGDARDAQRALTKLTKEQLDVVKASVPALNDIVDKLQNQLKMQSKLAELEKLRADAKVSTANSTAAKLQAELDAGKKALELAEAKYKAGDLELGQLQKAQEEFEELEETIKKTKEVTDELYNAFGNLLKGNLVAGLKGLGKSISKTIGPKIMSKVKDSLLKVVDTIGKGGAAGGGMLAGSCRICCSFDCCGGCSNPF